MRFLILLAILIGLLLYIELPQKAYEEIASFRGQTTDELTIDVRNGTADFLEYASTKLVTVLRVDKES